MIKIENIENLHGLTENNNTFSVLNNENKIIIENKKDKMKTELIYNPDNVISVLEKIKKLTDIKIILNNMNDREILSYIQSKGYDKVLWNLIGKAMHKFNMIEEGDKIAVGISGGKDSLVTLNAFVRVKKITQINFEIIPIHIHPKQDLADCSEIEEYCKKLGLQLKIIETNLDNMLFGKEKEKNPCFLCGRIRRGILYRVMKEEGINKLALGHHKDDIIETFLMNILYQGNRNIMRPAYISEEYGVKIIRPLAFVEEKNIISYAKKISLPIMKSKCPYETSENSKRLRVKNMIKELSKENEDIRSVILNSIKDLF